MLVEDPRFPLVTARLAFNAGTRFDPATQPGLSEATASLLTEGTKQRSSRQLAEEAASIGGAVNARSGPETLTLSGNALSDHTLKLLDLMADVARNATFPLDEVKLYQQNRKQQLLEQRSQSEFLADEKLGEMLFGKHPYSLPPPTPESIDKLTPEMLAANRDARLAPNNAVLILLGRLPSRDTLLKSIEARFGSWAKRDLPQAATDAIPAPTKGISLVDRPGSVQADVHIGHQGITRLDPNFFPLVVGNAILGGGTASRLFDDIREKKGYAYSVYSFHQAYKGAGRFAAVMQVRNEVAGDALKAMTAHLDKMAKEPVTPSELSNVKNYLSGNFVMRLERQEGVANELVNMKTMGLPNDWLEKYTA
ncbi:MAG: insulinase family protein, partial [Acidobacteria bacterium]|nr:insulinase family protein [Acidobacteriota bacterium]